VVEAAEAANAGANGAMTMATKRSSNSAAAARAFDATVADVKKNEPTWVRPDLAIVEALQLLAKYGKFQADTNGAAIILEALARHGLARKGTKLTFHKTALGALKACETSWSSKSYAGLAKGSIMSKTSKKSGLAVGSKSSKPRFGSLKYGKHHGPTYYVVNQSLERNGKLAVNGEHRNFDEAAAQAKRLLSDYRSMRFDYLLPVMVVEAKSKTAASAPLQTGNEGRKIVWLNGKSALDAKKVIEIDPRQMRLPGLARGKKGVAVGKKGASRGRLTERQKIGEMMQHWHASSGDPIYAVGSYYFSDRAYPNPVVVDAAYESVMSLMKQADRGEHGWTKKDGDELRKISAFLKKEIKAAYVRKELGHASGKKGAAASKKGASAGSEERNRETSRKEIDAWMKSPPDRALVYYNDKLTEVSNWMGVKMGDIVHRGKVQSRWSGGRVQAIRVRGTNGASYHGVCNLTGGNYCRLRRMAAGPGLARGAKKAGHAGGAVTYRKGYGATFPQKVREALSKEYHYTDRITGERRVSYGTSPDYSGKLASILKRRIVGNRMPKDLEAVATTPNGLRIRIEKASGAHAQHRLFVWCSSCREWIPYGRVAQHSGGNKHQSTMRRPGGASGASARKS